MPDHLAVIIGINYDRLPPNPAGESTTRAAVNPLRFAEADAQDMTAAVQASGYDVVSLIGPAATRGAIIHAIRQQALKTGQDGLLLVHFSGHGQVDPDDPNTAYLLPVDTDPQDLVSTAIPLDELAARLLDPTPTALTLLDCCHSGFAVGMRGEAVPDNAGQMFGALAQNTFRQVRGRIVLTACAGSQLAREVAALGHGVFTHYTLQWWTESPDVDDLSLASYVAAGLERDGLPPIARGGAQEGR